MNSLSKRNFVIIVSVLFLSFLGIAFVFDLFINISTTVGLGIYWTVKIVCLSLFIPFLVYSLRKKRSLELMLSVIVIQFLPLLARCLLTGENPLFVPAIILSIIVVLAYLMCAYAILNKEKSF